MLTFLFIFLIAFAPGIFWLWIVYTRDRYQPEPRRLVIRTFLLGMLVSIPVAVVESFLYPEPIDRATLEGNLASAAYVAFAVAGVTEELGKFLVVRGTMYRSKYFDEPIDGIVYSSSAALGFASLENLVYVLQFGVEVMLARGPVSTLAHAVFSAFWGYPLALRKAGKQRVPLGVAFGLLIAIIVHGLFNFILFRGGTLSVVFLPFFAVSVIIFFVMIRRARRFSRVR